MKRGPIAALLLLVAAAAALAQQRPLTITGINPSGTNVSAARQIVIQFNRAVVPIGRMDRTAAEIPIEITPALACQWRWLDTSALACQLGDGEELRLATRYTIVVNPGIRAEDGATTAGVLRREFVTERPRVGYAGFATWRSPGTPVIRAVFTQPVSQSSVREHVYLMLADIRSERIHLDVRADEETREAPRFIPAAGRARSARLRRAAARAHRRSGHRSERRRSTQNLAAVASARAAARCARALDGRARSRARRRRRARRRIARRRRVRDVPRVSVSRRRLRAVRRARAADLLVRRRRSGFGECNPLRGVGLSFSAPVLASQVKEHVDDRCPISRAGEPTTIRGRTVRDHSLLD